MEYMKVISTLRKIRERLKNEDEWFKWDDVNIAPATLMSLYTYGLLEMKQEKGRKYYYRLSDLAKGILQLYQDHSTTT